MSYEASPFEQAPTEFRALDDGTDHLVPLTLRKKSEMNAQSRICQLPTEILCRIFLMTRWAHEEEGDSRQSPYRYLPNAFTWIFGTTHVCSHWRRVAVNEPTLWTLPALFLPGLAKVMLDRSRMARLLLEIDHRLIDRDLMELTLQHMPHTKKINIMNAYPSGYRRLFDQLPSTAPMLEILILYYEKERFAWNSPSFVTMPTSLFCDVTSLRYLSLRGLDIQDWSSPLFRRLTQLCLNKVPKGRGPSIVQFRAMLASMPCLEGLALGDACPDIDAVLEEQATSGQRLVDMPNLRHLEVASNAAQVKAFHTLVEVPPQMKSIISSISYKPSDLDFHDLFSAAARIHLPDTSSWHMLALRVTAQSDGVAVKVTIEDDFDDEPDSNAVIFLKYASPRQARDIMAISSNIFNGIFDTIDWTKLKVLNLDIDCPTVETLTSTAGALPNLKMILLRRNNAKQFITALHSEWDADPEVKSVAFENLDTIMFYQVDFSFDEEDADEHTLPLDLLQDCLMSRCERGVPIEYMDISLCEGICEGDVAELDYLVPDIEWDWKELGFASDEEEDEPTKSEKEVDS